MGCYPSSFDKKSRVIPEAIPSQLVVSDTIVECQRPTSERLDDKTEVRFPLTNGRYPNGRTATSRTRLGATEEYNPKDSLESQKKNNQEKVSVKRKERSERGARESRKSLCQWDKRNLNTVYPNVKEGRTHVSRPSALSRQSSTDSLLKESLVEIRKIGLFIQCGKPLDKEKRKRKHNSCDVKEQKSNNSILREQKAESDGQ